MQPMGAIGQEVGLIVLGVDDDGGEPVPVLQGPLLGRSAYVLMSSAYCFTVA